MLKNIKTITAAIDYIESHLYENLDLETIEMCIRDRGTNLIAPKKAQLR